MKNVNENQATMLMKEPQECFKNVCTEAIGRLEALEELCFYAKQEDEPEVNIADALKIQSMAETVTEFITKKLNGFLAAHGVHVDTQDGEEAC